MRPNPTNSPKIHALRNLTARKNRFPHSLETLHATTKAIDVIPNTVTIIPIAVLAWSTARNSRTSRKGTTKQATAAAASAIIVWKSKHRRTCIKLIVEGILKLLPRHGGGVGPVFPARDHLTQLIGYDYMNVRLTFMTRLSLATRLALEAALRSSEFERPPNHDLNDEDDTRANRLAASDHAAPPEGSNRRIAPD